MSIPVSSADNNPGDDFDSGIDFEEDFEEAIKPPSIVNDPVNEPQRSPDDQTVNVGDVFGDSNYSPVKERPIKDEAVPKEYVEEVEKVEKRVAQAPKTALEKHNESITADVTAKGYAAKLKPKKDPDDKPKKKLA